MLELILMCRQTYRVEGMPTHTLPNMLRLGVVAMLLLGASLATRNPP